MRDAMFGEQENPRMTAKFARAKALQAFEEAEVKFSEARRAVAEAEATRKALNNEMLRHAGTMNA